MSKVYDVVAVTGTYTNKQGEEKPVWKNCGAVIETPKGLSLKIEVLPIGSDGWFKLFEPKQAYENAAETKSRQSPDPACKGEEDFSDDIPFN